MDSFPKVCWDAKYILPIVSETTLVSPKKIDACEECETHSNEDVETPHTGHQIKYTQLT